MLIFSNKIIRMIFQYWVASNKSQKTPANNKVIEIRNIIALTVCVS